MGRTVTDVAIMLGIMQTPFGAVAGQPLPNDYTQFLQRGSLNGKRIGRACTLFRLQLLRQRHSGRRRERCLRQSRARCHAQPWRDDCRYRHRRRFRCTLDDEFTALLFEFKVQIAQYLQTLGHTKFATLADLIAFDNSHCVQELVYYGQEVFEAAEMTSGDLTDPVYVAALKRCDRHSSLGNRRRNGAQQSGCDRCAAPNQFDGSRGGRLSEFFDAGRHSNLRQTRGGVDVQHVPARAAANRNGVRSRARVERAEATAIPQCDHTDSERRSVQQATATRQGAPPTRADLRPT